MAYNRVIMVTCIISQSGEYPNSSPLSMAFATRRRASLIRTLLDYVRMSRDSSAIEIPHHSLTVVRAGLIIVDSLVPII